MMSPAGPNHGQIANELAFVLTAHVKKHALGRVYAAETGFMISRNPDTVRAPDVAFLNAVRAKQAPKRGYFQFSPDLVVEVLSPDDTASEVGAKVREWLAAGTHAAWVVDPEKRTITVHRSDETIHTYAERDELVNEPPLPGLRLNIADIFA